MRLFLLNSRENNKSRKIGFTILGFFYHFLKFIWFWKKKKKGKTCNSLGPILTQVGPTTGESASARWLFCAKGLGVWTK
jgi:hypothetical protein